MGTGMNFMWIQLDSSRETHVPLSLFMLELIEAKSITKNITKPAAMVVGSSNSLTDPPRGVDTSDNSPSTIRAGIRWPRHRTQTT